jgi:hypothetical protein
VFPNQAHSLALRLVLGPRKSVTIVRVSVQVPIMTCYHYHHWHTLAQAVLFVLYFADELDARPSKRPLKEEGCETEFVYSVSQFFRRLAESDDFLQVLEIFMYPLSQTAEWFHSVFRTISKKIQSSFDRMKLGYLRR